MTNRVSIRIKNLARIFLVIACFILFRINLAPCDNAEKRSVHWEFAGWYGGGFSPNITFDPNVKNRVYLVSDVAGIWKSDNLGEQWVSINNNLGNLNVSFLEVASSSSDILYAGTSVGLFRSKTQGKSWELCDTKEGEISFLRPHNYRSLAVSKKNPAKLVIGTKKRRLYSSIDFGASWTSIELPENSSKKDTPISALQYDINEKGLYIALDQEFYYYSFEQKTWKLLFKSSATITDFFISKDDPSLIYLAGAKFLSISKDAGNSWSFSTEIPKGIIYRIAVVKFRKKSDIVVIWSKGWDGGIYSSNDSGKTWTERSKNRVFDYALDPTRNWVNGGEKFSSIKVNPFDSRILFATSIWGVFRSDDGGINWREKINGAANTVGSDISISPNGEIYVATMDNGLLKSVDGGKKYQAIFPKQGYREDINGHVWRVIVNPKDSKILIATSSPWNVDLNQVIISQDGGKSFIFVRNGLPSKRPKENTMWEEGYPRAIALDPNHPWIVYLGIDGDDGGGLFVSRDAGWHWQYSKGQPGSRRIYNALAVDPTNSDRIFWGAYGEKGGVYVSEDKGLSWKYVFSQMTKVFDLAINPDGWIYIAGDMDGPAVFISKNNGRNWSLLKKFPDGNTADALLIHPDNAKKIAVSAVKWFGNADGKIYESEDGGQSWSEITGDLPSGQGAAAMAFNFEDSCLYITRYAGSVYKTKW